MVVYFRKGDKLVNSGNVRLIDDQVVFLNMDSRDKEFLSEIGVGTKGYTPKDKEEYMKALARIYILINNSCCN
jgi:hypothetical protein